MNEPFWKTKTLAQMSHAEWESLCDGCAQCCLVKLRDDETGAVGYTNVVCHLLDRGRCRCTDYAARHVRVPDCIAIDATNVLKLDWLPETCAYKLLANGRELEWWHPLVSGDRKSVHLAGVSVRGRAVSEVDVHPDDLDSMVIRWVEARAAKEV